MKAHRDMIDAGITALSEELCALAGVEYSEAIAAFWNIKRKPENFRTLCHLFLAHVHTVSATPAQEVLVLKEMESEDPKPFSGALNGIAGSREQSLHVSPPGHPDSGDGPIGSLARRLGSPPGSQPQPGSSPSKVSRIGAGR